MAIIYSAIRIMSACRPLPTVRSSLFWHRAVKLLYSMRREGVDVAYPVSVETVVEETVPSKAIVLRRGA